MKIRRFCYSFESGKLFCRQDSIIEDTTLLKLVLLTFAISSSLAITSSAR